ncbi:MAG TPA: thioesterase family protein [Thermoanaerobaculia bacterium]|nr:thioesterase family protein [Thermoanaerobaculia bacterium]
MAAAFYEKGDGEGLYVATELTRGPWEPGSQHAGPPSALLGRELERMEGSGEFQVGRVVFEILRPVPIGPVSIETRVLRPGRKVRLVEASLSGEAGELMRATAWQLRTAELELPAGTVDESPAPQGPEEGWTPEFFPTGQEAGYQTAMEFRSVAGSFLEAGPATFWLRMRQPLVAGEEPTPLQRALVAADVGNGISAVLDYHEFVFINVDLTVHFERMPEGKWVCVDAVTRPQPSGIGTAESVLFDQQGRIGRAAQSLLIEQR